VAQHAIENDLRVRGICRSPLTGAEGNVEFFIYLSADRALGNVDISQEIEQTLSAHHAHLR
jgi:hypothetical protein